MSCLFELWNKVSAPVRHSSTYWPHISEEAITDFINGTDDFPTLQDSGNSTLLLDDITKIERFLEIANESDSLCRSEYIQYEWHRLSQLQDISTALSHGHNDALGKLDSTVMEAAEERIHVLKAGQSVSGVRAHTLLPDYDEYITACEKLRLAFLPYLNSLVGKIAPNSSDSTIGPVEVQSQMSASLDQALVNHPWKVQIVAAAANTYIDHSSRTINLPSGMVFRPTRTNGLIAHEIGAHIVRAENGKKSYEKLAGVGMNQYSEVEEALGAVFEKLIAGSDGFAGLFTPFIVLLANQRDNSSFRSVYEGTYDLLRDLSDGTISEDRLKHAAFTRCQRFMRLGTSEVVDVSGIKYALGTSQLITYVQQHEILDIEVMLAGKYDLNNSAQLNLIRTAH